MNYQVLKPKMIIDSKLGPITINYLIGSGGQGEVFHVTIGNKDYALKWYFKNIITDKLIKNLTDIVDKGSPHETFIWPIDYINNNGFGYIMNLLPEGYYSLEAYVAGNVDISIKNLVKSAHDLVKSFHKLHAKGLAYQDIAFGNIFINPNLGKVLIIDNDNVTTNNVSSGIFGTAKFLAPELISGKKSNPNADTDRFSLAILLFYLLTLSHPFHGKMECDIKCYDPHAQNHLYGNKAVFIYDPKNTSNRPVAGFHNNAINLWKIWPKNIQDLFIKTFTKGLKDVSQRTREYQWSKAFLELENYIYTCPSCGVREMIYDPFKLQNKTMMPCTNCSKLELMPRVKINDFVIAVSGDTNIYQYHFENDVDANRTVLAKLNYQNKKLSFIHNLDTDVKVMRNGESIKIVGNQKTAILNGDIISMQGGEIYVRTV